jgi:hypothetical protein
LPKDDEIDRLLSQSELRLEAARHLLREGFSGDAVSRAYYNAFSYKDEPISLHPSIAFDMPPRLVSPAALSGSLRASGQHQKTHGNSSV